MMLVQFLEPQTKISAVNWWNIYHCQFLILRKNLSSTALTQKTELQTTEGSVLSQKTRQKHVSMSDRC